MEFLPSAVVKPGFVPPQFEKHRIPFAAVSTYTDNGLTIFSQRIRLKRFTIQFHIISSEHKQTVIHPRTPADILTLHYMLRENIHAYLHPGIHAPLRAKEHNMFLVNGDIPHRAIVHDKDYWCFHIDIHSEARQMLLSSIPLFDRLLHVVRKTSGAINPIPYKTGGLENMLIRQILHCKLRGPQARIFFEQCANELLLQFTENLSDSIMKICLNTKLNDQELANLYAIQEQLHTNLKQPYNLHALAHQFLFSPERLEECFESLFGRSPQLYLNARRMMRAFELIGTTQHSFETIAHMVGIDNNEHFSQLFHDYFGKFPSEVRTTFH